MIISSFLYWAYFDGRRVLGRNFLDSVYAVSCFFELIFWWIILTGNY
jgi:hypothetical protein